LLIPFLELVSFLKGAPLAGEVSFILSLIASVGLSLLLKKGAHKSAGNDRLTGGEAAEAPYPEMEQNSFSDGKIIAQYLDLMFSPDGEVQDLLGIAKKAVFADSVSLFMGAGSGLKLRSSTDVHGGVIPSNGGLLHRCFEEKKTFVLSDMNEGKQEPGYLKKDKISSMVAVPVTDDNFPLGVMTADSSRVHAFSSADSDTLELFSKQITRILQRERVYPQVQRSYAALKILNEESSKLLSSLNEGVIVQNLIEGSYRIAPTETIFFIIKGREAEISQGKDLSIRHDKTYSIKGTVLDLAAKNMEPVYISDVRNYRSPIMPFKIGDVNSVFLLPMFYERDLLGILALLLEKVNALSPYQIELLEVFGKQASTSMANARFHAEIERLAITDGLTGLFNHKQFQERLAQEFNRTERFPDPLSLLLIDIDYFKRINDTYGHPVGDSVLKRVANIIKKTIRSIDISARYGGEEFAVVLVGTDEEGAMNMAERLRKTVMDTKFVSDKSTFSVTISIGISTNAGYVKKKEELVDKADKALYKAKGDGRNQSVLWRAMEGN
jgi:diguanylate cyclase (GGDEF)-like protein